VDFTLLPIASVVVGAEVSNFWSRSLKERSVSWIRIRTD